MYTHSPTLMRRACHGTSHKSFGWAGGWGWVGDSLKAWKNGVHTHCKHMQFVCVPASGGVSVRQKCAAHCYIVRPLACTREHILMHRPSSRASPGRCHRASWMRRHDRGIYAQCALAYGRGFRAALRCYYTFYVIIVSLRAVRDKY